MSAKEGQYVVGLNLVIVQIPRIEGMVHGINKMVTNGVSKNEEIKLNVNAVHNLRAVSFKLL